MAFCNLDLAKTMTETASKGGLMEVDGLIMGVANERSIAWSVASLWPEGFSLRQNEAISKGNFSSFSGSDFTLECDVANDANLDPVFVKIKIGVIRLCRSRYLIRIRMNSKVDMPIPLGKIFRDNGYILLFFTNAARRATPLMGNGGSLITQAI